MDFVWSSEVRAHEIDAQGIVNNAHYLCYFDHVRTLHIYQLGINWVDLSQKGFDLVLANTNISYLKPLRPFQAFSVHSTIKKEGKLKMVFHQTISSEGNIICTGINTVVCVDRNRNKPIPIDSLPELKRIT